MFSNIFICMQATSVCVSSHAQELPRPNHLYSSFSVKSKPLLRNGGLQTFAFALLPSFSLSLSYSFSLFTFFFHFSTHVFCDYSVKCNIGLTFNTTLILAFQQDLPTEMAQAQFEQNNTIRYDMIWHDIGA